MNVTNYIKDYLSNYYTFKEYWNYEDRYILLGCQQMYEATKDEFYKKFILNYVNSFVTTDELIANYEQGKNKLDIMNIGKTLFFLYNETQEERYYKIIEYIMEQLKSQPRLQCGNFWYEKMYPNQIWLESLYVTIPFYMAYETIFNKKENYNDIIKQFTNVRKHIFDDKNQLHYHPYDETGNQEWVNKETSVSNSFSLCSMGWYLMSLIDTIDAMSIEIFETYKILEGFFKEAVKSIMQDQHKNSKIFYRIRDRSDVEDMNTETSAIYMITYAILKGCRLGVLSQEKYKKSAEETIASFLTNKLVDIAGTKVLTVASDPKEMGEFMMAYSLSLMSN